MRIHLRSTQFVRTVLTAFTAILMAAEGDAPRAGQESHGREGSRIEAGAGAASSERIGGALRYALRAARERGKPGGQSIDSLSTESGSNRIAALSRHFFLRETASNPEATFKALLASGSKAELDDIVSAGGRIRASVGRIVSFDAPLASAGDFSALPAVRFLDIAKRMTPEMDISVPETGATLVRDPLSFGATGAGILVASIDTGHDVKHRDFRTPTGQTRFKSALNLDPTCRGPRLQNHPDGCFFDETKINKFLKGKTGMDYSDPAASLGHGSHTLGTAGGNGLATGNKIPAGTYTGMAPEASLLGVKVFDDIGQQVGDITEALEYLTEEQQRLGNPPLVVNLSLGQQFGAHDGSDIDEITIDTLVNEGDANGIVRVFVKSAGNSELDDIYFAETAQVGVGLQTTFTVPTSSGGFACTPAAGSGNDIMLVDMWYEATDNITVKVAAPNGTDFFENTTGNTPTNVEIDTPSGTIFVDCPGTPYPGNGDRECVFGVDDSGGFAPAAGVWTITITGNIVASSGDLDAWIAIAEKGSCFWGWDDPTPGKNLSLPGTAQNVITVGAYVTKVEWENASGQIIGYNPAPTVLDIASFSSTGPTRDGRLKPEIAAPGMGIASTRSKLVPIGGGTEGKLRSADDGKHLILEGTSMASPHVAGAIALLLDIDPTLHSSDLRQLLMDSAATDIFTDPGGGPSTPNAIWGAGKLEVAAAAGMLLNRKIGVTPEK